MNCLQNPATVYTTELSINLTFTIVERFWFCSEKSNSLIHSYMVFALEYCTMCYDRASKVSLHSPQTTRFFINKEQSGLKYCHGPFRSGL